MGFSLSLSTHSRLGDARWLVSSSVWKYVLVTALKLTDKLEHFVCQVWLLFDILLYRFWPCFWNPDIFKYTVKACVSASLHLTVSFFVWLFSRNVKNGTRTRWLNVGEVPVYCFGCKSQYVGTWAAWRRTVLSECSSHQWMKHLHCSDSYWWDTRGKKVWYLAIMNPRML